jgi:hypothetical protein
VKKQFISMMCFMFFLLCIPIANVSAMTDSPVLTEQTAEQQRIETQAYRSGRGTFTGGARNGVTTAPRTGTGTGYTTGPRTPTNRVTNPAANPYPGTGTGFGTGLGGLFGGFAAGTLLGSLFNPFGFGGYGYGYGGGGFSIIGILFWGAILYFAYRMFRRVRGYRR